MCFYLKFRMTIEHHPFPPQKKEHHPFNIPHFSDFSETFKYGFREVFFECWFPYDIGIINFMPLVGSHSAGLPLISEDTLSRPNHFARLILLLFDATLKTS